MVDLRDLFRLGPVQETEKNCVIVAEIPVPGFRCTMGLLVDEVCEVVNITEDEIQFPALLGRRHGRSPISSTEWANLADRDVILLEIETFLQRGRTQGHGRLRRLKTGKGLSSTPIKEQVEL